MTKILIDEASANQPQAVPLHEQLAKVPANARLVVESEDGTGTLFIPVGRLCQEAAAALRQALADAALDKMADNARELGLSYEQSAHHTEQHLEMVEQADKFCDANCVWTDHHPDCVRAEQPAQQEPYAWKVDGYIDLFHCEHEAKAAAKEINSVAFPVYTSPQAPAGYAKKIESLIAERDALKAKLAEQPAPAQPLTDERIEEIAARTLFPVNFARAIEAAHGITKGGAQ